jgi:WD40 repeat protein
LLARWGQGNPEDIAYTPDGKYLVVGTSTGLYFYNPTDFSLIHAIDQPAVSYLAISPDSQVVAAVVPDQVILYNISTWQMIQTQRLSANSADFSPDGKILILGINGDPGSLQLREASTGKYLNSFKTEQGTWAVKFSPRGDFIATAGYSTTIWALDGTITTQFGPYVSGGRTVSVSFSPDGEFLAEGSDNLHVYRVLDNGRLVIYRDISFRQFNPGSIIEVTISPNGKMVAFALTTGVHVWDLATGTRVFDTTYDSQYNNSLAWSMDSMSIAVATYTSGVQVWDVDTGRSVASLNYHSGTFSSLAWSPDGQKLAVGAEEGSVNVYDLQEGAVIQNYASVNRLNSLAFSPDGATLAIGSYDRTVNIWNISATISRTLEGVGFGSTDVTFSSDGSFFAACSAESGQTGTQVRLWSTRDWSVEKSFSIGNYRDFMITGFALAPDQRTGAISYVDISDYYDWKDKIQIISIVDGSVLTTLDPVINTGVHIISIAFSPDGTLLAARGTASRAWVWQTSNWNLPYQQKYIYTDRTRVNPFTLQYSIAWSPNGQLLAVGTKAGGIQIFDTQSEDNIIALSAHTMYTAGVAFSPDGRYLASVSLDGTVTLWGIR